MSDTIEPRNPRRADLCRSFADHVVLEVGLDIGAWLHKQPSVHCATQTRPNNLTRQSTTLLFSTEPRTAQLAFWTRCFGPTRAWTSKSKMLLYRTSSFCAASLTKAEGWAVRRCWYRRASAPTSAKQSAIWGKSGRSSSLYLPLSPHGNRSLLSLNEGQRLSADTKLAAQPP